VRRGRKAADLIREVKMAELPKKKPSVSSVFLFEEKKEVRP